MCTCTYSLQWSLASLLNTDKTGNPSIFYDTHLIRLNYTATNYSMCSQITSNRAICLQRAIQSLILALYNTLWAGRNNVNEYIMKRNNEFRQCHKFRTILVHRTGTGKTSLHSVSFRTFTYMTGDWDKETYRLLGIVI